MSRKTRRLTALVAALAAIGAASVAAAPALAVTVKFPFKNWAVFGSLTPKKLGEPIVLPKESTFNGEAEIELTVGSTSGTVKGNIFVPPFNATVKILGLPTTVGLTFTQVGEPTGKIVPAPEADCAGARFSGSCVTLSVDAKANLGITVVGILGIGVPTACETAEPVALDLSTTLTEEQLVHVGSHFTGTVDLPNINCDLFQLLLAPVLSGLMSGPENPYDLNIGPAEPSAPTVSTEAASGVSQVSAQLHAAVNPKGIPLTACHFEYGTTTSYGKSVPCAPPLAGSGFAEYAQLTGLSEATPYHYRIVASNELGTSDGSDQTFTTLGAAGAPEYGQCVTEKHGNYSDGGCTRLGEKRGKPTEHAGSFEFTPGPAASCVLKKKGEYTDSSCTTKAAKAGKGSFEKAGGPGYTSMSGTVKLEIPGLSREITCTASSAAGEVTREQTGIDRIAFTGCSAAGKKCTSEGANSTPSASSGVIDSNRLHTQLLGPIAGGEVWTQLTSSEHEPYLWEFGCEGVRYRSSGSLAGAQTGGINNPSHTSTTTFAVALGEQGLSTEASENGGKSWSSPDTSELVMSASNTSAAEVEIRDES